MVVRILGKQVGTQYTNTDSLEAVKTAIETGLPIEVWWYETWGEKVEETCIYGNDAFALLITDKDVSPFEEQK